MAEQTQSGCYWMDAPPSAHPDFAPPCWNGTGGQSSAPFYLNRRLRYREKHASPFRFALFAFIANKATSNGACTPAFATNNIMAAAATVLLRRLSPSFARALATSRASCLDRMARQTSYLCMLHARPAPNATPPAKTAALLSSTRNIACYHGTLWQTVASLNVALSIANRYSKIPASVTHGEENSSWRSHETVSNSRIYGAR